MKHYVVGLGLGLATLAVAGPKKRVSELDLGLARINHPEPLERLRAQWNLEALVAEGAVDPLLKRLEGHQKLRVETVTSICQVLGELGVDEALPRLAELARAGKQPEVRIASAVGLARLMSKQGCDALAELVKDTAARPEVRHPALVALAYQRDPRVLDLSQEFLRSVDPMARRVAYRALGYSQNAGATDTVAKGLSDREPLVSSMAAWALAKLEGEGYTKKLRAYVKRLRPGALRFMLVDALARLGEDLAIREVLLRAGDGRDPRQYEALVTISETSEKRGAPVLREVLARSLRGRASVDAGVLAAFTLGKLQDRDALDVLSLAARKAPLQVQRAAARALGELGFVEAEPALLKAGYQRDLLLRFNALIALGQLTGAKHANKLRKASRDRDPIVRYAAVVALEASRDPKVQKLVQPLTKDSAAFVRVAAERALATLGGAPGAAVDDRDPKLLDRFHALEREYVMMAKTQRAGALAAEKESLEAALERLTYMATCGGSHPPKPSMVPALERLKQQIEAAYGSEREQAVMANWVEQTETSYDLRRNRTRAEHERVERAGGY